MEPFVLEAQGLNSNSPPSEVCQIGRSGFPGKQQCLPPTSDRCSQRMLWWVVSTNAVERSRRTSRAMRLLSRASRAMQKELLDLWTMKVCCSASTGKASHCQVIKYIYIYFEKLS